MSPVKSSHGNWKHLFNNKFTISGLKGSGVKASLVVGIIVVRYILLPVLGIGIVKGAVRVGLVNSDPLYLFVLLLQYALPPAMNIGTKVVCLRQALCVLGWILNSENVFLCWV